MWGNGTNTGGGEEASQRVPGRLALNGGFAQGVTRGELREVRLHAERAGLQTQCEAFTFAATWVTGWSPKALEWEGVLGAG